MSIHTKFVPEGVPDWQQPFWDSLKEHSARVQKCDECGAFRYIPKEICNKCYSSAYTWAPISGLGTVYTYTIVHRAPTPAYQEDAPYAIVHVTMEEGFRMVGNMIVSDLGKIAIDQPVRIGYHDLSPEWTILQFELA